MSTEKTRRLRRLVVQRLESLEQAGVQELPKVQRKERKGALAAKAPAAEAASPPLSGGAPSISQAPMLAQNSSGWKSADGGNLFAGEAGAPREISTAPSLEVLQKEVALCTRCDELACTRTQTVFGVGNPRARLCFVGEAPGADEDRQGEPFVGRAGQLLNKIIEACKMRREDVYICNILKCRPPGNRNPDPVEAANCRRFLERQLELVEPEFICCLGAVAAQNLLGTPQSIGKLRNKVHPYRGSKVVCTYHPAYLLRNPAAKKDTWDDMKFLMRAMGVEL
jgi:DNA polymerase